MRVRAGPVATVLVALWSWTCAAPLPAAEVFRWVDATGVTHFSESPPPGGEARRVERVPLADFPATPQAPDYRAWLEVAHELERDRLERERQRAEAQRLRQQRLEPPRASGEGRDYGRAYGYVQPWRYPRPCPYGWRHCGDWRRSHGSLSGRGHGARPGGWGPRPPPTGDPTLNRQLFDPPYRHPRYPLRHPMPYPGVETSPALRIR